MPRTGRVMVVTEGIQNGNGISRSDGLSPFEANEGFGGAKRTGDSPSFFCLPLWIAARGVLREGGKRRVLRVVQILFLCFCLGLVIFFSRPRGRLSTGRRDNALGKFCRELHGEGHFFRALILYLILPPLHSGSPNNCQV